MLKRNAMQVGTLSRVLVVAVAVSAIMLLFATAPASAAPNRDEGRIRYGQTVSGDLWYTGDRDRWYFYATAGDVVNITYNRTSGSLQTSLVLLRLSDGQLYRQTGTSCSGSTQNITGYRLGQNGTYYIDVYKCSGSGDYRLSLIQGSSHNTGTGTNSDSGLDSGSTIYMGRPITGELHRYNPSDTYYFTLSHGATVTITMDFISGRLDPYLRLYGLDASGNWYQITYNDDDDYGGTYNSRIQYGILAPGRYKIVASYYGGTENDGRYRLRLEGTGRTW
jgi:hypothetical protein